MKLPKSVVIKGRRWKVTLRRDLWRDAGAYGLTDVNDNTITLDKDLKPGHLDWVFWHEYCHAMLYESSVTNNTGGLSDIVEEIICDNFADAMTIDKSVRFITRTRK